jgi:hypothetical protein
MTYQYAHLGAKLPFFSHITMKKAKKRFKLCAFGRFQGISLGGEGEVGLHHALAIDGLEVVAHRNDVETGLSPLLAQCEGFFAVGMVALIVVGYQHEGG